MATKREKRLKKAHNIARNNMQKTAGMVPHITAKNSHIIIRAFNRFQKSK